MTIFNSLHLSNIGVFSVTHFLYHFMNRIDIIYVIFNVYIGALSITQCSSRVLVGSTCFEGRVAIRRGGDRHEDSNG